ncbi:glycoside hydrolase family 5 protein [Coniochaeta sp. 2T2.1]|nr:glycoside hydrolase family 5 protein [Coniochaeta sp. 2T2.1]
MLPLVLLLLSSLTLVSSLTPPSLPLHTSSRWILDSTNKRVKLRCVNWAGHLETHIPEGLHKQSIASLADWISSQGFNCVRLTYSIDHALNPDLKVSDAFAAAAAASGASRDALMGLYQQAVGKNPFLANATTREVFRVVVDTLWERAGVMTLLDNHVSRAGWCCNLTDGNGWWDTGFGYNAPNSRFFHTREWLDGLGAMAVWARDHRGVVAMGLRNEIREFLLQGTFNGRQDWYDLIAQAGKVVHAANGDVLVVVGGTMSSTDLTHVRGGKMLDTSAWPGKHVWEMHAYSFTVTYPNLLGSCDVVKAEYGAFAGFVLEQGKAYTAPLILSEFGVGMTGGTQQGLNEQDRNYLSCLVGYMENNDAEWAIWALQGSYYVRDGQVDYDEGWGVLDHEWSGWRNGEFPAMLGRMWGVTQGP